MTEGHGLDPFQNKKGTVHHPLTKPPYMLLLLKLTATSAEALAVSSTYHNKGEDVCKSTRAFLL